MTDYAVARKTMVDNQLRTSGITDRRLLVAMGEVPRERFVPAARESLAYIDEAHALSATRKLAPPAPFAKLVQLAAIEHTDQVLDVGCATGYSTAVLAKLAAHVVGIDSDAKLATEARRRLADLGVSNATIANGTLTGAGKADGPYDVIVIEGTVPEVPDDLFDQLKPDGRLVAVIAEKGRVPVARLYAKSGKGLASRADFDARLPPLLTPPADSFVF